MSLRGSQARIAATFANALDGGNTISHTNANVSHLVLKRSRGFDYAILPREWATSGAAGGAEVVKKNLNAHAWEVGGACHD